MLERAALDEGDAHRLVGIYRRMRSADEDLGARTAYSVRLADIASAAHDRQLAIRSITRVLEASVGPRPYGAMARLAVELETWALAEAALHADGDTVGLARLLEATSDDQKRIAASWRSIAKKEPENIEAHGGLERALSRMGSREGLADTHGSLAKFESDPTIGTMHALLAGHLYENEDVPEQALEFYGRAFKESPYRGKAFDALVRLRGERGEGEIVGDLFKSLGTDDLLSRADALHDAGAGDAALRIYKEVVKALPENVGAAGLPALVRYEHALAFDDRWKDVFEVLGRRHAGSRSKDEKVFIEAKQRWVLSERMADSDEAWNFYRALHEDQPDDRDVLENLARIAGARGERELAIQFLDGLSNIALSADDAARYQRRIAEVHIANGAASDARSAYLRALDHLPEDLDSMNGLKTLAREEQDWQALVGILSREAQLKQGEEQVALVREIANMWEVKLEDSAVAADSWRSVLELVPGDQTALQHLVDIAEASGNWASFIDDGKALIHYLDGEERSGLMGRMGRAAMQHLRREDEAIRLLDEASTGTPPNLQAAEDLEQIHAARGSWDLVVECTLRRARGSEGEAAVALYLQAARSRRDHLRDRKGAAAAYEEALAIAPEQTEALQYMGYYHFENSDLELSIAIFERLEVVEIEADLDDFDVQMEQALYYFRFGDALRRLERQDDAVQRYEQALDLNASHLPTLEAVGPLYVERSDWDSASRVFRQILQLTGGQGDPERLARVYSCLGTVEHAQGNTDKAVLRYKRALELQPNDIAALRGYSCVLYAKKDWNNLLNSYNNIIYHAKEKVAFIDAYLMKGFVLDVHMSLADKAAQHYEKSLSFDPSHPVALLRLSELALRKDDWDRALSYASRALSVGGAVSDTVRAQLMVVQAIGYTQSGRPEEGQAALESAQTVSHDVGNSSQTGIGDPSGLHEALRRGLQEAL
jgi:tetratricopeptide (TPR) repeat protein